MISQRKSCLLKNRSLSWFVKDSVYWFDRSLTAGDVELHRLSQCPVGQYGVNAQHAERCGEINGRFTSTPSLHRDTWSMECGQWWGYREPGESHVCDNEARNAEAYTFIISLAMDGEIWSKVFGWTCIARFINHMRWFCKLLSSCYQIWDLWYCHCVCWYCNMLMFTNVAYMLCCCHIMIVKLLFLDKMILMFLHMYNRLLIVKIELKSIDLSM